LGLFDRQIGVAADEFPADSGERRAIVGMREEVDGLEWAALDRAEEERTDRLVDGVNTAEKRIKALYDAQTSSYYSTTTRSLHVKEQGQLALGGLVGLVALLGFGWIVTIRRANRNDLRVAYEALVTEMHERRAAEDAVRLSEQRFRSLVQRASDLTGVTDEHGI